VADSSEVDSAIVARLSGDAELVALLPDGVYFDVAAQGLQRFVLVSVVIAFDRGQFGDPGARRALEDITYAVKAVTFGSSGTTAKQAAARIDALLEDQPLTIPGYHHGSTERIERIRDTEDDETDASIRWQHRGGRYRVLVTPVAGGTS
jgi:hypothetical protein